MNFVIPPKKCVPLQGSFRWPATAILASARIADDLPLEQLAGDLAQIGVKSRISRSAVGPCTVRIVRGQVQGDEAYHLSVAPGGIEILCQADAGAYYAIGTLREMVRQQRLAMQACRIEDRPDFSRRGVYHDCSRGKVPTLETLKAFIEHLAQWKINELQLYVENVFTFERHPLIGKGYSPFTPADIIELQEHCKKHHVRFVGSLATFGHMEKILALKPYQHLGELPGFRGLPGGTTLCPGDAGSIRLVEDMLDEYLPLLEASDFNLCGDEPWELGDGRSKARVGRIGKGRVYLDFLLKVYAACRKHGKRVNAWADIVLDHAELLDRWPKDIVMLNWDYGAACQRRMQRTGEIAQAGLQIMVCPGTNAWNTHGCRLAMGMKNIAAAAKTGLENGAQGILNTDWGDGGHRNTLAVSLHNLAYGGAHGWNSKGASAKGFDAAFTPAFCTGLFGPGVDAGQMSDDIRVLGSAHEAIGWEYANSTALYSVLVTPIAKIDKASGPGTRSRIDEAPADAFLAHRDALSRLAWRRPNGALSKFQADTLAEFKLATQMDMLACGRALLTKTIGQAKPPRAADVRREATQMQRVIENFQRVWLLRNRPSRLEDNLALLNKTIAEYRSMFV